MFFLFKRKPAEFQKEETFLGTGNGGGQLFTDPSDLCWKVDHIFLT